MPEKDLVINIKTRADVSDAENIKKVLKQLIDANEKLKQKEKQAGDASKEAMQKMENGAENAENKLKSVERATVEDTRHLEELGRVAREATTALEGMGAGTDDLKRIARSADEATKSVGGLRGRINGMKEGFGAMTSGMAKFQGIGRLIQGTFENLFGLIANDLLYKFVDMGKQALNAENQLVYFSDRLGQSKGELASYRQELSAMQKEYKKIDMKAVGATAEEIALKNGWSTQQVKENIGGLTEMTAVMSSEFVKQGRSQQDAVLAIGDALDGQFQKLKEIGITQETLKKNGWNGNLEDQAGLVKALNKNMHELGYDQTAKDITNLDEAMTALNVAGGELLASFLIPLTPTFISITNAVIDTFNIIQELVGGFMSLVGTLPDWAKEAGTIGLVVIAFQALALVVGAVIIPMIADALWSAILTLAEAFGVEIATNMTLAESFWAVASGVWATLGPILIVVAIIGALIYIVYELGKALGWWDSFGGMIDAVVAGLTRLWNAFINNPNVQGFIKDLTGAWNELTASLSPVIEGAKGLWAQLFPESAKGKVDVVRMIIDFFGALGDTIAWIVRGATGATGALNTFIGFLLMMTSPVLFFVSVLRKIVCILLGCSPGIVPALQKVQETFSSVFGFISAFIGGVVSTITSILSTIIGTVRSIIAVFQLFLSGQINLQQALSMIWALIKNAINSVLKTLIGNVTSFASSFASKMYNGATNAVNNFTSQISRLPSKLQSELTQMLSAVNRWASTLPQKFWNAGVNAVKNFLSALGIASPGTMQRMLIWEITEMGRRVPLESQKLLSNVGQLGYDITDEFGNPSLDIGFGKNLNKLSDLNMNNVLLDNLNLKGNEDLVGNNYNFTINIQNVDNEERVNEIVEAVRKSLAWSNTTAGRSV